MAWTNSKMFTQYFVGTMNRTLVYDIDTDTVKAALYGNGITPDNTAASGSICRLSGSSDTGSVIVSDDTGNCARKVEPPGT
mgnify:CR=1 FL=1